MNNDIRHPNLIWLWVITNAVASAVIWIVLLGIGVGSYYSGGTVSADFSGPLSIGSASTILWGALSLIQGSIFWRTHHSWWLQWIQWTIFNAIGWTLFSISGYWALTNNYLLIVIVPLFGVLGIILWIGILPVLSQATPRVFAAWIANHLLVGILIFLVVSLPPPVANVLSSGMYFIPGAIYGYIIGYVLNRILKI